MRSHRLGSALAAVGLGCSLLFSVALARDTYSGISSADGAGAAASAAAAPRRTGPSEGELVARMSVPRLSLDSPVFEGVGVSTLARGAGHVPGTALPGDEEAAGASVIAVPRGPSGAAVSGLKLNDLVRLATPRGLRGYRVVERRVFEPTRFTLADASNAPLTLVTVYPSGSPGPAPMRLAVSLEPMPE